MAKVLSITACAIVLTPVAQGRTSWPTPPSWWLHDAACIAWHESTNDPDNQQNPAYRGLYQIGWQEWASVGGSGDPANASRAEQSYRAWLLWLRRGWAPWTTAPLCGL
jgi:hypothetical protein